MFSENDNYFFISLTSEMLKPYKVKIAPATTSWAKGSGEGVNMAPIITEPNITYFQSSFSFLDSPSSSSATTYKIQFQTGNAGGGGVRINRGYTDTDATSRARTTSTVTLMEVDV